MTNKNIKQNGGTDDKTLTNTNIPSINTDSIKKQMPLPIKRIPYDLRIFSFLCILGILFRIIFSRTAACID